jgi:hypothetical protein
MTVDIFHLSLPELRLIAITNDKRKMENEKWGVQPALTSSSSITASSINMTGISSRIGYTRRQLTHFNPPPSGFNSTFDLQAGHRSISRRSGLTPIAKRLVKNESARPAPPQAN